MVPDPHYLISIIDIMYVSVFQFIDMKQDDVIDSSSIFTDIVTWLPIAAGRIHCCDTKECFTSYCN